MEWRANRLADALAKHAAGHDRVRASIDRALATAEVLVWHEAAVLGAATYAANNHVVQLVGENGQVRHATVRDSKAVRRPRRAKPPAPPAAPHVPHDMCACVSADEVGRRRRKLGATFTVHPLAAGRARAARAFAARSAAQERACTEASVAAFVLRPRTGPTAAERLEAVRLRVRERAASV